MNDAASPERSTSSRRSGAGRRTAWIDPALCIGCTKCIEACAFDAIIGARRRMHTVIEALCIGCDLCVPPCPVDCIAMIPIEGDARLGRDEAIAARARREARAARLARRSAGTDAPASRKREIVDAALRRARERSVGGDESTEAAS